MSTFMDEAQRVYSTKDFGHALDLYYQEISERSDNALAHKGAARCLYNLKRPLDAIEELQKAIDLDPKLVMAYVFMAQIFDEIGDAPRAREQIRRAYEIDPVRSEVLALYGTFLLFDNELDEAKIMLEKALQINPDIYAVYRNLSVIYFKKRDRKKMLYCAKQLRRLQPSFKNSIRLGIAYMNYTRLTNVLFVSFFVLAIYFEVSGSWGLFLIPFSFFIVLILSLLYVRN